MTAPAQPAKAWAHTNPWVNEGYAFLRIGIPMGLTQLIQFSTMTIDTVMIGWLGPEYLAAAAVGMVIYFTIWMPCYGPASAVSPLVSQSLGADPDNVEDVRRSIRMGLWTVGLSFPLALLILFQAEAITLALGQPQDLASRAAPYILALAPGLPFALGTVILRNFLAALNRTQVPLLIIILMTILNGTLNYVLIYGNWGAPRLELVGAGLATSIASAAGFLAIFIYVHWTAVARRFHLFRDFLVADLARMVEILKLGGPIFATMAFEMLLFNAAVFLMGRIGVTEVAAYQVAVNVAAVAFMLPLGLSMAGSVRVGLAAGAGDRTRVRQAAVLTIGASIAAILLVAIPCLIMPHTIAGLYLDASDPNNEAVLAMVAQFLPIAGAFALFDAIQVAAAQCLRGLKDVRMPMVITGISYWIIGFPVAAGLGLYTSYGAVGVWWGLLAGLLAAAILLGSRLWIMTRP